MTRGSSSSPRQSRTMTTPQSTPNNTMDAFNLASQFQTNVAAQARNEGLFGSIGQRQQSNFWN